MCTGQLTHESSVVHVVQGLHPSMGKMKRRPLDKTPSVSRLTVSVCSRGPLEYDRVNDVVRGVGQV